MLNLLGIFFVNISKAILLRNRKVPENNPGEWVGVVWTVRWRGNGWYVVLQGLTEHLVKGHIGPGNVLLHPGIDTQLANLVPKAVEVFFLGMGIVRAPHTESRSMFPGTLVDVNLDVLQELVQVLLFLFVKLSANPRKRTQHGVDISVTAN